MDNQSKGENEILDVLRRAKNAINPSRELLMRILSQLEETRGYVTEEENSRYNLKKGRDDKRYNLLDQIQNLMTSKFKFLFPLGGVAVVLLLLIVLGTSKKEAPLSPTPTPSASEETVSPTAIEEVKVPQTSNVTLLASTLLDLASADEKNIISDASADAGFVNLETTEISDFGQSVNGSF